MRVQLFDALEDVLAQRVVAHRRGVVQQLRAVEHDPDVLAELLVRRRAEERVQVRDVLDARPRLLDDRAVARRARRQRARHGVADVAGAGLHVLRHRRLVAVPVPVEGLVVDARGLVEDRERDDAGRAGAVGPVALRRVRVVAVVAVHRLGDEVAGEAGAGGARGSPRRARARRARRSRSTRTRGRGARRRARAPSTASARARRRDPSAARAGRAPAARVRRRRGSGSAARPGRSTAVPRRGTRVSPYPCEASRAAVRCGDHGRTGHRGVDGRGAGAVGLRWLRQEGRSRGRPPRSRRVRSSPPPTSRPGSPDRRTPTRTTFRNRE